MCRTGGTRLCLHVDQLFLYIAEPGRQVVLELVPALLSFCHRLFFQLFQLGVQFHLVRHQLVSPDVGLEDRFQRRCVVSDNLLLDVQHRDVGGDRHFTKREVAKQGRFTDTVTTDQTITTAMRHRERGTGKNLVAGERDINIDEIDILGFALGRARQVERVDLHKHFLIALLLHARVDQFRALVQGLALARPLFNLGLQLGFGLGQLAEVDAGCLAPGVAFEIDLARHGDSRGHGLTAHVDRLVEPSRGGRLALTLGRLRFEVGYQTLHTVISDT